MVTRSTKTENSIFYHVRFNSLGGVNVYVPHQPCGRYRSHAFIVVDELR